MPALIACLWLLVCIPACAPAGAAPPRSPQSPTRTDTEGQAAHGLRKDFSDAPAFAAHFDDPARDAWQRPREVIAHLHVAPGSNVVDLGAGTGYFLEALSEAVGPEGRVLALDVEPQMVAFMERRISERGLANVEPRHVTADDPGLAPRSVARVLIVNTWHHLDQRAAYAEKLAEALQPGGEIWIVDFTRDSDLGPPVRHRIAPAQVVAELEQAGLHAEIVQPEQLPKQYMVRASR
jgi:predicted methyltransferase